MVNITHHQRGAGCSTTPAIRSVIQLKFRLFRTSGTRASGRSGEVEASPSMMSGTVDALSMVYFLRSGTLLPFWFAVGPRVFLGLVVFLFHRTCHRD